MSQGWAIVVVAIAALTLTNTALLVGLLKRHEAVLARAEAAGRTARRGGLLMGLDPGSTIGSFHAVDGDGATLTDVELGRAAPYVLVLLEPGCAACETIMTDLGNVGFPAAGLPLAIVLPDIAESHARNLDDRATWTLYQHDDEVSAALGAEITPLAFVIGRDGEVVAQEIPSSVEDVLRLTAASEADSVKVSSRSPDRR